MSLTARGLRFERDTTASLPMLTEAVPEHFALDVCARWMKDVRTRLDEGPGFVLLDRLPLDRMGRQEAVDLAAA